MKFFVTDKYQVMDPSGAYESLTQEEKLNLMYDALDIYEKNFGQKRGSKWPEVIVGKAKTKNLLGVIKS